MFLQHPNNKYQIHLKSNFGQINVHLINKDQECCNPVIVEVPPRKDEQMDELDNYPIKQDTDLINALVCNLSQGCTTSLQTIAASNKAPIYSNVRKIILYFLSTMPSPFYGDRGTQWRCLLLLGGFQFSFCDGDWSCFDSVSVN